MGSQSTRIDTTTTHQHHEQACPLLALAAFVATAYAQANEDCQVCVNDIIADVDVCKDVVGQEAIVTCVMEAVKTSADCITCACEILTQVFKMNESMCK